MMTRLLLLLFTLNTLLPTVGTASPCSFDASTGSVYQSTWLASSAGGDSVHSDSHQLTTPPSHCDHHRSNKMPCCNDNPASDTDGQSQHHNILICDSGCCAGMSTTSPAIMSSIPLLAIFPLSKERPNVTTHHIDSHIISPELRPPLI